MADRKVEFVFKHEFPQGIPAGSPVNMAELSANIKNLTAAVNKMKPGKAAPLDFAQKLTLRTARTKELKETAEIQSKSREDAHTRRMERTNALTKRREDERVHELELKNLKKESADQVDKHRREQITHRANTRLNTDKVLRERRESAQQKRVVQTTKAVAVATLTGLASTVATAYMGGRIVEAGFAGSAPFGGMQNLMPNYIKAQNQIRLLHAQGITAGATALGGVAGGAAAGAAIGSFAPGIGTLIGAGAGALAGLVGGKFWEAHIARMNAATQGAASMAIASHRAYTQGAFGREGFSNVRLKDVANPFSVPRTISGMASRGDLLGYQTFIAANPAMRQFGMSLNTSGIALQHLKTLSAAGVDVGAMSGGLSFIHRKTGGRLDDTLSSLIGLSADMGLDPVKTTNRIANLMATTQLSTLGQAQQFIKSTTPRGAAFQSFVGGQRRLGPMESYTAGIRFQALLGNQIGVTYKELLKGKGLDKVRAFVKGNQLHKWEAEQALGGASGYFAVMDAPEMTRASTARESQATQPFTSKEWESLMGSLLENLIKELGKNMVVKNMQVERLDSSSQSSLSDALRGGGLPL